MRRDDTAFFPGVDFDPTDPDEVELVGMVTEQDRLDAQARELRERDARIEYLTGLLRGNGIEYEE